MKKNFLGAIGILLIMIMLLSACQSPAAPTQSVAPVDPTAPAESVATAKPEEPTATEAPAVVTKTTANIVHYYSGELGKKDMSTIIEQFNGQSEKCEIVDNTTGHEDFKTQILVMLAGE